MLCMACITRPAFAQSPLPVQSSNFAGALAVGINPANICAQPVDVEFHLASVYAGISNNHFYIDATNMPVKVSQGTYSVKFGATDTLSKSLKQQFILRDDIQPMGSVFGAVTGIGPSILISGKKNAVVLGLNSRSFLSTLNVSSDVARTLFKGSYNPVLIGKPVNTNNIVAAGASWFEMNISYAHVLSESRNYMVKGGFSAKPIVGIGAAYFIDHGLHYTTRQDSTMEIRNSSIEYGYAASQDPNDALRPKGVGFGLDLGITILRKTGKVNRKMTCPYMYSASSDYTDYKWRLGFSVLDLGLISFDGQARARTMSNANIDWRLIDTLFHFTMFRIDRAMRSNLGSSISSQDQFTMYLPTSFSMQ